MAASLMALADKPVQPHEFKLFRELIYKNTGIWLRDGKQTMLSARLSKRLRHHGCETLEQYYHHLEHAQDGGREMVELINCITTNKTSFFRESHHFDFMRTRILPHLLLNKGPAQTHGARIWSACCSSGEEPYSIAVTLEDFVAAHPVLAAARPPLSVYATDIDTTVLARAERGVYPQDDLSTLSLQQMRSYFLRGKGPMQGQVRAKPVLRQLVQFARLNLMDQQWPVSGVFDLIFFRNALIYFQQPTQEKFLRRMLGFLRPGGFLFLGHAEHVPWLHDVVEPIELTIYRKRGHA